MSDSSPAAPALDALACASLSDAGRVRAENQDAAGVLQNTSGERLLVVADGMGGHLGGETASRMCLELIERCFRDPHGSPEERLRRGIVLSNEEIYSHALGNPELRGMGTTAVALLLVPGGSGWVAWVGDSRAYRLRDGVLEALTRDHSLMAEWISLGVLTAEAAETHPRRHELTRALGQSPDVAVDVATLDVRPGDRFLLCSDGLHGYVPERALRHVLGEGAPEDCARTLVERANANGGSDNVSVVVAVVPSTPARVVESPPPEIDALIALDSPPESAPQPAPDLGPPSAPPQPVAPEAHGSLTFAEMSFGEELAPHDAPSVVSAPESPPAPVPAPPAEPDGSLTFAEMSFGEELTPGDAPSPAPTSPAAPAPAPPVEPDGSLTLAELSFGDVLAPEDAPVLTATSEPATALAAEPPGSQTLQEMSFGDVLAAEDLSESAAPELEAVTEIEAPLELPAPPRPARTVPQLPLLDPPVSSREIRIPRMTPVRARRTLDTRSMLAGAGSALAVAALAAVAWLYTASSHAPEPAPLPLPQARTPAPTPRPVPVEPPASIPEPPRVAPEPPPRPEIAEVERTPYAKLVVPAPVEPPAPVAPAPPAAPVAPTRAVPPAAPPPAAAAAVPVAPTPPAAPDPATLATSAGFELPAPVARFVDDWLRAVSTHDLARLGALGLRAAPDELAGSFATRDSFRLLAASVDEERSSGDRWYVRLVVSYAFRDATGRFRTQDEQRWILRDAGGALRYEGRWQ